MNTFILTIVLAALTFSCNVAAAADIQMQSGFNYNWWGASAHNKASQFYIPISIAARHDDFSLAILTAYANTHLEQAEQGATISHLLDTKLNASYALVGKLPVDIMFGLDFNLPSGKTDLNQRELSLIMDPDLIDINNFGEGLNVNPTITFAKVWGKWATGIGFGYLWRGEYDYSSVLNITDYKPGDIYKIDGELRYYVVNDMYARLLASHSWYGNDKVRKADFYQEGDFSMVGLGLNYNRIKKWDADVTLRGIFREKSSILIAPGTLDAEPNNSHGNEWIADIGVKYQLDEQTALRSALQGRYFTKNDYPENSPGFIGHKEKISLGIGATRNLNSNLLAGLDIKGFVKNDGEIHSPAFQSARDYHGFSVALTLSGNL